MSAFGPRRRARRPSLTPMIDVVFLLLVFFMLASRFGSDQAIPLQLAGSGGSYSGPPRVVDVLPEGLRLNGAMVRPEALPDSLSNLMSAPTDTVILRAQDEAALQRIVDVMQTLSGLGMTNLVLVE